MSRKKAFILILLLLEVAIIIPLGMALRPLPRATRHIAIDARRYGYSNPRVVVNRGDTIILKFTSRDVTHGLSVDGYPVDLIARKGMTFQRQGHPHGASQPAASWTRVNSVKFIANRGGKFVFRCTETCGNLHPFMTGELIVRPNTPYHFMVTFSLWLVTALFIGYRVRPASPPKVPQRINLLHAYPRLARLVKQRGFQFFVILPNFVVFYLFILSSLWGSPVGNRNIVIVFVWILWWFVLKAVIVPLGGRLWCLVCPLPAPAEWLSRRRLTAVRYFPKTFKRLHHRFTGLQRDWPRRLRNIWLQNILFLCLISFGMILITRPIATAIMFLAILGLTLILALVFRQRVFCLYLCPVGGFLGTYSMASMTAVRAIDPQVCIQHREKSCLTGSPAGWACPWNQYVGNMKRNNYCGICTECIKSCPKDNVGFFVRPFGTDRRLAGYDEMFNVMIMLVVAIAFSITMLGPWGGIRDAANVTESGNLSAFLAFLAAIWGSALLVFPGAFILTAKAGNRLAGRPAPDRDLTLRLAYMLIPVGIFAWIAFSLPPIMINYGYIISVLSDPLGLGWDLFNTADSHFSPLIPDWIPVIQGVILLAGLYLGISRGRLAVAEIVAHPQTQRRTMLLPALFALAVVNVLLKIYLG